MLTNRTTSKRQPGGRPAARLVRLGAAWLIGLAPCTAALAEPTSIFDDPDNNGKPTFPGTTTPPVKPKAPDAPKPPAVVPGVTPVAPRPPIPTPGAGGPAVKPPVKPTVPAVPKAPARAPAPVPVPELLTKAERQVHDTYKALYAKSAPADRAALGKALLAQSDSHPAVSADRFVMLRDARDFAAVGGDVATAIAANDKLGQTFGVDALTAKYDVLNKLTRTAATPDDREELAKAILAAIDEAQHAGKYELMGRLAGVADMAAERAGPVQSSAALRRKAELTRGLKVEFDKAKAAAARLKANPADGDSSAAAGLFLCLVHGDWAGGIPMMALSTAPATVKAAAGEADKPTASAPQADLGDAWGEVAKAQAGYMRSAATDRAVYWYRDALSRAPSADRPAIQKRMESLPGQVPFLKFAAAVKDEAVDKTKAVGGRGSRGLGDVPDEGALLVGLTLTTAPEGKSTIVSSVQPIYLTAAGRKAGDTYGKPEGTPVTLEARDGYAIGTLVGKGFDRVDGLRVVYMRVKGPTLDPADAYESDWVGGKNNSAETLVGGDGKPVVGVLCRVSGLQLDGLGLIRVK